jgi:hypothetical protein
MEVEDTLKSGVEEAILETTQAAVGMHISPLLQQHIKNIEQVRHKISVNIKLIQHKLQSFSTNQPQPTPWHARGKKVKYTMPII